jgi:hypothetical protein
MATGAGACDPSFEARREGGEHLRMTVVVYPILRFDTGADDFYSS